MRTDSDRHSSEAQARARTTRTSVLTWYCGLAALAAVYLALLGRFDVQAVPDTAGYLDLGRYPEFLQKPRAPLYGALVYGLQIDKAYGLLPYLNFISFVLAGLMLTLALVRIGVSKQAALCVATALLFSDAFNMNVGFIHPEILAISLGLGAFALTLSDIARPRLRTTLSAGLCCGLSYVLRPSFLLLIPTLPLVFLVLGRVCGRRVSVSKALQIGVAAALPFLGVSAWRYVAVGSPTIVSFGGFQMSGMAGLILSRDLVARLPAEQRPLAEDILDGRERGESSGQLIGIPVDPGGRRLYESVVMSSFDVLAQTYDAVLYGVIAKRQGADESWVHFDRRLMAFSVSVLKAAPKRYLQWVVGASARLVGQAIVKNTPLMGSALLAGLFWLALTIGRGSPTARIADQDRYALVTIALAWMMCSGATTVLTTYPAGRYIYTASLLLAPLVVQLVCVLWAQAPFRWQRVQAGAGQAADQRASPHPELSIKPAG